MPNFLGVVYAEPSFACIDLMGRPTGAALLHVQSGEATDPHGGTDSLCLDLKHASSAFWRADNPVGRYKPRPS